MNDEETARFRASLNMPPPLLRLRETHRRDGSLQVTPEGELDIATSEPLRKRLRELQLARTPTVLDLSRISFIDCSGLRVILEALATAGSDGSRLEIHPQYSPPLRRLLELIHIAEIAGGFRGMDPLPPPHDEPSSAPR
jgi:anti-sigma B factor antagonist